jgi:hypothetical protein
MKAKSMSKEVLVISLLCRLAIVQCGNPLPRTGVMVLINSSVWKVATTESKFELLRDQVEKEYERAEGLQKNLLAKARELYLG